MLYWWRLSPWGRQREQKVTSFDVTFFRWETVSEALPDNRSASASPAVPCPASLRPSCAERGILPFRRRDGRRDDVAAFSCRRQRGKRLSRHALRPACAKRNSSGTLAPIPARDHTRHSSEYRPMMCLPTKERRGGGRFRTSGTRCPIGRVHG